MASLWWEGRRVRVAVGIYRQVPSAMYGNDASMYGYGLIFGNRSYFTVHTKACHTYSVETIIWRFSQRSNTINRKL